MAARAPTQVREPEPKPAAKTGAPAAATSSVRDPAAQLGLLKRKLEAAEAVLARETKALMEVDRLLGDPTVYVKEPTRAADLGRRREKLQAAVDRAEALWIEAAEAHEAAQATVG